MDPVAVVRHLGELDLHAAGKDLRVNPENEALYVLDNRFRRLDEPKEGRSLVGERMAAERRLGLRRGR